MRHLLLLLLCASAAHSVPFENPVAGCTLDVPDGWQVADKNDPAQVIITHGADANKGMVMIKQQEVSVRPDPKRLEKARDDVAKAIKDQGGEKVTRIDVPDVVIPNSDTSSFGFRLAVDGVPMQMMVTIFLRSDTPTSRFCQAVAQFPEADADARRAEIVAMLGSVHWTGPGLSPATASPPGASAPASPALPSVAKPAAPRGTGGSRKPSPPARPWVLTGYDDPEDYPDASVYVGPTDTLLQRLLVVFGIPALILLGVGRRLGPQGSQIKQLLHVAAIGAALGFPMIILAWKGSIWPIADTLWAPLGFFGRIGAFIRSIPMCIIVSLEGGLLRLAIVWFTLKDRMILRTPRDGSLLAMSAAAGLAAPDFYRAITGVDSFTVFLQGTSLLLGELAAAAVWGYYMGLWRTREHRPVPALVEGLALAGGVRFLWLGAAAAFPWWLSLPAQIASGVGFGRFLGEKMLADEHRAMFSSPSRSTAQGSGQPPQPATDRTAGQVPTDQPDRR